MISEQQVPRFTIGQRVKVVVPSCDDEINNSIPSHFLTYNEKIGYIANTDDVFSPNSEYYKEQPRCYEVFITKIGVILELPEKCLEPADSRRYVM